LAFLLFVFAVDSLNGSPAFPNEKRVAKDVKIVLELYGMLPPELIDLKGHCDIEYSDIYTAPDGHRMIDIEIIELNLRGVDIEIRKNPGPLSIGSSRSIDPGIDFPAESFFDVFTEVQLPGLLPGDTLINYEPIHLTSIIGQFPPYHETYVYMMGGPPILLYNTGGIEVGAIHSWEERVLPYYPPEAHISVPTAYRSEVAIIAESGLIEISASLPHYDDYEISFAEFSYRHCGEPVPFMPFYTDYSGEGTRASTIYPKGEGDGWCGYFEPGSEPFEGQCVQFEAAFHTPYGIYRDTVDVFVDPTPPIPEFVGHDRDSIGIYHIDSFFDITYKLDDEMAAPGNGQARVFPLVQSFSRELTPVDQLGLGTDLDSTSCGPASAASCLKYFADNGHPELDNAEGDESNPDQSAEDIARELQGPMGTGENGTSADGMVAGIKSYLKSHGQSGWTVSGHPVDDASDLGEMFREMEADSEDVMVLLEDTVTTGGGAGDTMGHWVTLGSREVEQVSEDSTVQRIDFMDPWGGGGTADNKYDVGTNGSGDPTTEGYDLDGGGASASIAGYIKVSPPDGGSGGGSRSGRPADAAPSAPGWIPIDTGVCRGNGLVDTLHWYTAGFPTGLYLMEIITTDDQGFQCRDLRLCLIPDLTSDVDPETPEIKTGLLKVYPNPFNPSTSIVFSIEKDGPVTLAVYDIMGRRVRLLIDGKETEAGVHTVPWDGRGDDGGRVSSGIYLCRLLAGGRASAMKAILLR
jgi:hypothetical protein